ncbi:MAG: hypothetical protein J6Z20_02020, partial [Bacteroidales bacterium]|nr:hypothetical protein [Bacteroidales bacterium]
MIQGRLAGRPCFLDSTLYIGLFRFPGIALMLPELNIKRLFLAGEKTILYFCLKSGHFRTRKSHEAGERILARYNRAPRGPS